MNDFDPARVTQLLVDYGLRKLDGQNLAIQLQDVKYCGGAGFLGDICPAL